MFEITVQSVFAAAHAIRLGGSKEPTHGHNWLVLIAVGSETLDANDLVCDFHLVESCLHDVIGPLRNRHLNETPPFDRINPTAERVAEHIAHAVGRSLAGRLPASARLVRVEVTEAPGCSAIYRPDPAHITATPEP